MTSIERFYRLQAPVYDYTRWLTLHGRRRCLERLGLEPTSRVLEVGCGTGINMARIVPQLSGRGGHFTGLDMSADMLSRAAAKARKNRWKNVTLVQSHAPCAPVAADFDAVLLSYCASMSDTWEDLVTWCCSRLQIGGRFVLLDFGAFEQWGALRPLMGLWLRRNHSAVGRAYASVARRALDDVGVDRGLGGYYVVVHGTRSASQVPS